MKRVLVYGDSNVWGDNFITQKRIADEKQWVNLLQEELKDKYKFIQEGLPGRLAGNDEIKKQYKNGRFSFLTILKTALPVDVIIIALGSNDLNLKYNKDSKSIVQDLLWYKSIITEEFQDEETRKKYFNNIFPEIIYILPPNFEIGEETENIFNVNSENIRQEIISYFKDKNENIIVVNNISLFKDGIHLSYEGHKELADIVKEYIINNEQI